MKEIIKKAIQDKGPLSLCEYISLSLYHPEKGYYTKQDPLTHSTDFITSPQMSQIFGEIIGLWFVNVWEKMSRPKNFNLVELGPGSGVCMSDIARASSISSSFSLGKSLFLYEVSTKLKDSQKRNLSSLSPIWINNFIELPHQMSFFFANEFFDALPIRQFKKRQEGWAETYVDYVEKQDSFVFCYNNINEPQNIIPHMLLHAPLGAVYEVNEIGNKLFSEICQIIKSQGGACLFIDYGSGLSLKNSLRAFHQHKICNPLENPGMYDITANINFDDFQKISYQNGLRNTHITTQGQWLSKLGGSERAKQLIANNPNRSKKIEESIDFIISPSKMGEKFKVFAVTHDDQICLEGF